MYFDIVVDVVSQKDGFGLWMVGEVSINMFLLFFLDDGGFREWFGFELISALGDLMGLGDHLRYL